MRSKIYYLLRVKMCIIIVLLLCVISVQVQSLTYIYLDDENDNVYLSISSVNKNFSKYQRIIIDNNSQYIKINRTAMWRVIVISTTIVTILIITVFFSVNKIKRTQEKLREKEYQLKNLIASMPDIVCLKNEKGQWLEANKDCIKFFELDKVSYRGQTSEELWNVSTKLKETFVSCDKTDEGAWQKESLINYEETIINSMGERTVLNITKTPLYDSIGRRKGILVIGRDISNSKKTQQHLYRSEEILRATLNATADGILVVNNERTIIDSNYLFRKMWKIPTSLFETYREKTLLDFVMNQMINPEVFKDWVNECYKSKKSDNKLISFKDGRVYEVFSEPLINKGIVEGRVWSSKDITLRKRMEKELSESEERYRRLVELSPDAIYMSVDGKNIFSNMTGARLLDVEEPSELIGKPILGFVYSDYYDTETRKIRNFHGGKAVLPLIEKKLIKNDGSIIDIEVASTYFEYKGKTALMSVVRDITERKKAQELRVKVEENTKLLNDALEYDKLKTDFFANISHEFRTPLNIILGAQQLFKYILMESEIGDCKEKVDRYLKIMKQNCYRLLRLVNNLIDITRIDAGFYNIKLKNINIVSIVEDITMSVADYIEDKGIYLEFDTDIEEKIIACDADKIERIMLNLLSNATKFAEAGDYIQVFVEDKGDKINITVKDTGIGIPKDKQIIIFERFRQVDKSFIRNHEGSGIGLSIVKSLVELHAGNIYVDSELGEGTKFTFELPVKILTDNNDIEITNNTYQSKIERIDVEFSDIYL